MSYATPLTPIVLDLEQFGAALYEGGDDFPVGFIGPSDKATEVAHVAAQWIEEGIEFEIERRAVVLYRSCDNSKPIEVDFVMDTNAKSTDVRYKLVKIEDADQHEDGEGDADVH